jgi:hypothetical protein
MRPTPTSTALTLTHIAELLQQHRSGTNGSQVAPPCPLSAIDGRVVGVNARYGSFLIDLDEGMRSVKRSHGAHTQQPANTTAVNTPLSGLLDQLEQQLNEVSISAISACSVNERTAGNEGHFEDEHAMRVQMTKLEKGSNAAKASITAVKNQSDLDTAKIESALQAIFYDRLITLNGIP